MQGVLQKDELQLRVMKEFQKLYHRVIDYTPPEELSIKISLLLRQIELKHAEKTARETNMSGFRGRMGAILNIFRKDPAAQKRQLIRYITDEEELHNFASPQGLLINGEVGCGKSMLMDIFAASLPHKSKMRWHYNNFILWVFNEMHQIQKERLFTAHMAQGQNSQRMTMENEFILFEVAQKMISKNTVLMLDEFMLPDIASANIIKILFTYYFKLGGVLVATSNKLPEELYSNEFHKSKFRTFVNILNSRCQSVDMRSEKDYRSIFASVSVEDLNLITKEDDENDKKWFQMLKTGALNIAKDSKLLDETVTISSLSDGPAEFTVYGRTTRVPHTFVGNSVCYLDFAYICQGLFSASDYITLASLYRTVILDNVPVMTTKMKNEARRFITLLDALYEAKCQLFMRTEGPLDELFFPDAVDANGADISSNRLDVQDEEMYAKTAIDMANPYRPNVSTYDQDHTKVYDAFKNSVRGALGLKDENEPKSDPDFKKTTAFTGEDEKFAYKRAVLRIREMVSSSSWRNTDRWAPIDVSMRPWEKGPEQPTFGGTISEVAMSDADAKIDQLIQENRSIKHISKTLLADSLPREVSSQYGIPFRQFNARMAPIFSTQNFWAMAPWTRDQARRVKDSIARRWMSPVDKKER